MLKELITGKPATALTIGGGVVAAVGAACLGMLMAAGVPTVEAAQEPPAPVEQPPAAQVAWQDTRAGVALLQALSAAPAGWNKDGEVQRAVTPPFPYSCPQPGTAPAISLAQTYTVNGVRIQVIAQAHTAGGGADAMARQLGNVGICSGDDGSASVSRATGEVPGIEAHLAATNRGGVRAALVSSRRGDVITHVVGPANAPVQALAVAFDGGINREIQGKCVQMDSKADDATRSPWAAAGYKPFTKAEKVSVASIPLPTIPDGATVKGVDLTGPVLDLPDVRPASIPSYPVWPAMPERLDRPEPPHAPPAKAVTETTVDIPAKDETGPGCGWAFTGMNAPAFDSEAAAKTKTDLTLAAMTKLNTEGKEWQKSVLGYWTAFADYEKAAKAYTEYGTAVAAVNAAWAAIDKKWATYNDDMAAFRETTKDRAEFLDRQKAAREEYDRKVAVCEAPQPAVTVTPPQPSDGQETPAPAPQVQSPQPRPGCPVQKPSILDQDAPEVGPEPTAPADPRPKS
jgi:hypothetical protein